MTADTKTIALYDGKAQDYATRFDSGDKPGKFLVRFMAALPEGGSVLDLGCGPGGAAGHMNRARFAVDAVDASSEMVRLTQEIHGIEARIATFDDLDAVDAYDGVWANFSLLHAPRDALPRHMAAIAHSLRAGGHFHIGMKTGTGMHRDHMERRYTYVEEDELIGLIADAGMEVVATDRGHEVGLAGTDDHWVVMLARRTDG